MIRQLRFKRDVITLWLVLIGIFALAFFAKFAFASGTHQDDEPHRITYNIVDLNGKPVAGQTVNIAIERANDNAFYDFADSTFKSSGWTTKTTTMVYDAVGEHYYRIVTIDQAYNVTGDYCAIISNDNATYSDHAIDCWTVSDLNKLIKVNR